MMKYYTSVLTKRTQAQSPNRESESAGCMPSLFRIFDFRKNPKLISNRNFNIKHPVVLDANAKHKIDGDLHEGVNKGAHMQSVKTLMEEEMAKVIPSRMIPSDKIQNQISEDEKFERNSILMIPPSPESFDFTNPIENSDLESNLSSKELYFQLHEHSDSTIFERISDSDQNFSWRREKERPKTNNNNNDNNSEGYNRIVILKPSLPRITSPIKSNDFSERNFNHFSIREIKRRLRHTIIESRRERDLISIVSDDSLRDERRISTGDDRRISTGEERRVSTGEDRRSTGEVETETKTVSLNSFSYEDARKHLMERVENLETKENFEFGNERTALSRLISFPDFDLISSPICTPKKEDDDLDLLDKDISKFECFEPLQEENSESSDILDLFGEIQAEEKNDLDESLDFSGEGSQNEAESLHLFEEEMLPNCPEILEEKKVSPVSSPVLGDLTKSPSRIPKYEEIPIQRTIIKFKEPEIFSFLDSKPNSTILNNIQTRSEFISTVIKASGLCNLKDSERWRKTESPLLDPFLFDEIGVSYDYIEESKILFDLIEEALIEIKNKYFIVTPWMNFINRDIKRVPFGETLIWEVCRRVEDYLMHQFPCTLDQVVKKDLDIGSNWMEIRPDMEIIVLDVGDEILDDFLEEIVFDLWF